MLAENTLLKTTCHFLLLLVGFDTLSNRKDYDRSPTLVGHHIVELIACGGVASLLKTEGESSAELDGSSLPPLIVEG